MITLQLAGAGAWRGPKPLLKRAGQAYRSRRYRSQRASSAEQGVLL